MARSPTPEEAGAINLSKEADIPDLWSAQTTRLTPMPSDGRTVGKQVASVVLGDPHDNPGGMVLDDMDAEALMDTREGRRIMDLIEGEAKQSVTLEMQEKINAQIRQDADSAELADRYSLLRQMSFEQGDNDQAIKARAQRSREDVSSRTRWYRTRDETAVPTTAANADEHLVSHTTEQFGETEVETPVEAPREELSDELLEVAYDIAENLKEEFDGVAGTHHLTEDTFAKIAARQLLNGKDPYDVSFDTRETIYTTTGVAQPLAEIDPFEQYQTTITVTVEALWDPDDPDSQKQVGLVSDDSLPANEALKLTVWRKAGKKHPLAVGDKIMITQVKTNARKRNGEWETNLCVDSDAEIHVLNHGDGEVIASQVAQNDPTLSDWDADSDTHQWIADNDHKQVGDTELTFEEELNAHQPIPVRSTCPVPDCDADGFETYNGLRAHFMKSDTNHDTDTLADYYEDDEDEDDNRVKVENAPEITMSQRTRDLATEDTETMTEFEDSLDIGPESEELCPECGSANTSSYQQQTGGADEGMTGFHSCADCDHKWRSGYGA